MKESPIDSLWRASMIVANNIERALRNVGLTYAQYRTLQAIASMATGNCTLGEIATALACSRGNLTGIMDRLERDGWIERVRSKDDRRVVNVWMHTTPDVQARWERAQRIVNDVRIPDGALRFLDADSAD